MAEASLDVSESAVEYLELSLSEEELVEAVKKMDKVIKSFVEVTKVQKKEVSLKSLTNFEKMLKKGGDVKLPPPQDILKKMEEKKTVYKVYSIWKKKGFR
ncbi:Hypothetical predicted protein [Octopus vulgaris]|uniref:Uncharacterized protein n=1 Tax=Octopus vulgaris TaxID=6645 RepID=A0AA36ANC6_OCTVU|nr:Hypothetical predicted protein [Octopus vulgaris]